MLKKILIIIPVIILLLITIAVLLHWQTDIVSDVTKTILKKNLRDIARFEYRSLSGDLFRNVIIRDLDIIFHNGIRIHTNYLEVDYVVSDVINDRFTFEDILFDSLLVFFPASTGADSSGSAAGESEAQTERTLEQNLNYLASSVPLKEWIAALPVLAIDDLSVAYGRIETEDRQRIFDQIRLEMKAYRLDQRVEMEISHLSGVEKNLGFQLDQLRVQIIGNAERITLNRLEMQTPRSQIFAHADLTIGDSLWAIISVEESHLSAEDFKPFLSNQPADSGEIGLSLSLVGQPNRFSATIQGSGFVNAYRLDSLVLDADYNNGAVNLRRFTLAKDTTRLSVKGRLRAGSNSLTMRLRHVNLADLRLNLFPTDLNGVFHFNSDRLDDLLAGSNGRIRLYHSTIDTYRIDTLQFAARARNRRLTISEPSYLRLGEGSVFSFSGDLDSLNRINFVLTTQKNNLATLTSAFALPPLKGNIDINFFLQGPLSNPDLEAYVWLPHMEKNSFFLDTLIAQIDIKKVMTARRGSAFLTAAHWQYGALDITETLTNFIFDSNRVRLDTLLFAKQDNYFSSTGTLENRGDTLDIAFDFFRLNYQQSWIENQAPLEFRLTPEEYNVENALLVGSDGGTIEIRGYWDRLIDDMQFGLYIQNFSFTPLQQFMDEDLMIDGKLNADFVMGNPHRDIELDMTVKGEKLMINRVPVGDVLCVFQYEQNRLFIDEFSMINGPASLQIDGDIAVSWTDSSGSATTDLLTESLADVKIFWKNLRLENYTPLFNLSRPLKGELTGQMNLGGTISNPKGTLQMEMKNFSYNKYESDSLSLDGHFNRDSLVIDHLALDLNQTDFQARGWQLIDFNLAGVDSVFRDLPFELEISSRDDHISFLGNLFDQVERLEGPFDARFVLGGTFERISILSGYFKMEDGRLVLSRIRNPITNIEIDATIENSLMTFHSLSGFAAKETDFWEDAYGAVKRFFRLFTGETRREGTLSGAGTIDLSDLYHPQMDLSLNTYALYLDYFIENTNFVISTDELLVQGRDTINVSGDITINEGAFLVDVKKLQKNMYLKRQELVDPRPLIWNLSLAIPGNFIVSSSKLDLLNNFSFEILGNFRSIQEVNSPSMDLTGHMEIISGKYGSWGQNFTIASGSISLNDPKLINPDINIRAEKKSGEYFIELILSGTLDELRQEVQVRSSDGTYLTNLSDQEVLSLVSLGQRQIDVAGAGGQVISTSVETALERGAEVLTGLDKVEIGSAEGGSLVDMQAMKLNKGIETASVSLGKYLTSNLYIEYTGIFGSNSVPTPALTWRPGNQIGLEYRINKKWSVGSNYMHTLRGNNIYRIALAWKTTF